MRYFKDSDGNLYAYDDNQVTADERQANIDDAQSAYDADNSDENAVLLASANAVVANIKDDLTELTEDEYNDAITPSTTEQMQAELVAVNASYSSDIKELSEAYANAALFDGDNQSTKQTSIAAQAADRKTQYATDKAAVIAKYTTGS